MSFRDRMRVSVSAAEMLVLNELQRRGLTTLLETQKGFEFIWQVERVHGTIIDFYWNPPINYAAYIDGPHHKKQVHERDDELITKALEARRVKVDRFQYDPPLTKKRLMQICDEIEVKLKNLGYLTLLPKLQK